MKPFLTQEPYKYILDGILKCSKEEIVADMVMKTWSFDKMIKSLQKCRVNKADNSSCEVE